MNEDVNTCKMNKSADLLGTVQRLLGDCNLRQQGYSQAYLVNSALNNITNAEIILAQAKAVLESVRT